MRTVCSRIRNIVFPCLFLLFACGWPVQSRAASYLFIDPGDTHVKTGTVHVDFGLIANSHLYPTEVTAYLDDVLVHTETVPVQAVSGGPYAFSFETQAVGLHTLRIDQTDYYGSVSRSKSFNLVDAGAFLMTLSPTVFPASAAEATLTILANGPWKLSASTWAYTNSFENLDGYTGDGDRTIRVLIALNGTGEVRAGTIALACEPDRHVEFTQSPEGYVPPAAPALLPGVSLLLLDDAETVAYEETDQYYSYAETNGPARDSLLVFKGTGSVDGVVASRVRGGSTLTTNFAPATGFTRVVMTANRGDAGFLVDLSNTTDALAPLAALSPGADQANKALLDDFMRNAVPVQAFNAAKNRLEITLPKPLAQQLTASTYAVHILDASTDAAQLGALNDDPVIGWYFEDSEDHGDFAYTLPGSNEGGTVSIDTVPIVFDDSQTKVIYRQDAPAAYETPLFRVAALDGGAVLPKDDATAAAYTVSISNVLHSFNVLYRAPEAYEAELYTYVFSYTADGRCSLDPGTGTPVYLGVANMNYKVVVAYGPNPPDEAVYSSLGSTRVSTGAFGDAGFTLDRVWIGVVER